jgi:hypothetical protein
MGKDEFTGILTGRRFRYDPMQSLEAPGRPGTTMLGHHRGVDVESGEAVYVRSVIALTPRQANRRASPTRDQCGANGRRARLLDDRATTRLRRHYAADTLEEILRDEPSWLCDLYVAPVAELAPYHVGCISTN